MANTASQTRTRFTGSLSDVTVADLVQTLTMSPKGGVMHLYTDLGDGEIWVVDGQIVDAALGDERGETALYRLLMSTRGTFELKFKAAPPEHLRFEIPPQHALMEGMRRLDEWTRDAPRGLNPGTRPCVDEDHLRAWRDDLDPEDVELLDRFDGRRCALEVVAQPDGTADTKSRLGQIGSLRDRGLLRWATRPALPRVGSGVVPPAGGFWGRAMRRHLDSRRPALRRAMELLAASVFVATLVASAVFGDWRILLAGQLVGWGLILVGVASQKTASPSLAPGAILLSPILRIAELGHRRHTPT